MSGRSVVTRWRQRTPIREPNRRIHGVVPRLLPWSELTECVTQRFKISGDCHHLQGAAVARHASTGEMVISIAISSGFRALIDLRTGFLQTAAGAATPLRAKRA